MEIVAFDTDDKADGSGKAGITWISKTLLNTDTKYDVNGDAEKYSECDLRQYLYDSIAPLIPSTVSTHIIPVTKVQATVSNNSTVQNGETTSETVWIPSAHEVATSQDYRESIGATYHSRFTSASTRIKKTSDGAKHSWWLRSCATNEKAAFVDTTGATNSIYQYTRIASVSVYIALGFCTN